MPRIDEIVLSTDVGAETVPKRLFRDYIKCPVCQSKNRKFRKKCKKCNLDLTKFITF
jgi:hypothetical protein